MFVFQPDGGAVLHERIYGRRTSLANGSVKGSYTGVVQRIRIGAGVDQKGNHLRLRFRMPVTRFGEAVSRIVQWLRAAPVVCVNVRSMVQQGARDLKAVTSRRSVQGRVARIKIMVDFVEKEFSVRFTCSADAKAPPREPGIFGDQPGHTVLIVADNRPHEAHPMVFDHSIACAFRHGERLSPPAKPAADVRSVRAFRLVSRSLLAVLFARAQSRIRPPGLL